MREKHFSLFNVSRWGEKRPACCDVVPTIFTGPFLTDAIAYALDTLITKGSLAAPGYRKPEGIIIFHTASGHLYKKTIEKDELPKSLCQTQQSQHRPS